MRFAWLFGAVISVAACGKVHDNRPDAPPAGCATAAECTDPAAPFCVNQHCQGACSVAADCTDPAATFCATNGECVGCLANTDCNSAAPVCDMTEKSCRGCERDTECSGGVCVEADGTCSPDSDVAFVTMMGTDAGTCSRASPCATIPFALGKGKKVIHVLGGSLNLSPLNLAGEVILDGETTTLSVGAQTTITIPPNANVIVEGFRLGVPATRTDASIETSGPTKLRLWNMEFTGGNAQYILASNSSNIELVKSHAGSLGSSSTSNISCPNSIMKVDQNVFEKTIIDDNSTQCELTVTRNHFESNNDGSVRLTSGTLVMENNVIIHSDGFNDSISLGTLRPGSTIRYNTIVNTTAVASDGAALSCDASVAVTSNVFAYNSGHPITGIGCAPKYSVFDNVATTAAGTGNQTVPIDSIFVDRAGGDYHLSASSAAKMGAEPGLTMTKIDFEGHPRPNPAGTTADSGAFEAP